MADVLSLKWIEGNDIISSGGNSASLHGQSVTPTFNIDDPTLWPPLTVLSGLASGYCERRAALDDNFVVGTTEGSDVVLNWSTDAAARSAITSYCMNNLAIGNAVESLFKSDTEAITQPIGSAAAANYMTTMDSAITALVTSSGYTSSDGQPFYKNGSAFATLAEAAASDAAAAGSALTGVIVSAPVGGSTYLMTQGAVALPVEWAKQRKWMLEQVKYMGVPASQQLTSPGVYSAGGHEYGALHVSGSGMVQLGYMGSVSRYYAKVSNSLYTLSHDLTDIGESAAHIYSSSTGDIDLAPYALQIRLQNSNLSPESAPITLYFTSKFNNERAEDYMWLNASRGGLAYVSAGENKVADTSEASSDRKSCFVVLSGGTLNVGRGLRYVFVEDGGFVSMLNSAVKIDTLFVFTGGRVKPYVGPSTINISSSPISGSTYNMAYKFVDGGYVWNFNGISDQATMVGSSGTCLGSYVSASSVSFPPPLNIYSDYEEPDGLPRSFYVCDGAVVTLRRLTQESDGEASWAFTHAASPDRAYISGGTMIIESTYASGNYDAEINQIVADKGAVVSLMPGASAGVLDVRGGTIYVSGGVTDDEHTKITHLEIRDGGELHICGGAYVSILGLELTDGTTVNVADGTLRNSSQFMSCFENVTIDHYCAFGLTASTIAEESTPGWLTLIGSQASSGSDLYTILGTVDSAEGLLRIQTYLGGAASSSLQDMSSRIHGDCYVGGTAYNFESACINRTNAAYKSNYLSLCYGARLAAKNRDTGKNHYPEFYVRQFPTSAEVSSAFPS